MKPRTGTGLPNRAVCLQLKTRTTTSNLWGSYRKLNFLLPFNAMGKLSRAGFLVFSCTSNQNPRSNEKGTGFEPVPLFYQFYPRDLRLSSSVVHAIHERLQLARARRMSQLAQR